MPILMQLSPWMRCDILWNHLYEDRTWWTWQHSQFTYRRHLVHFPSFKWCHVIRRFLCAVRVKTLTYRVLQKMATRLTSKKLVKYRPATLFLKWKWCFTRPLILGSQSSRRGVFRNTFRSSVAILLNAWPFLSGWNTASNGATSIMSAIFFHY